MSREPFSPEQFNAELDELGVVQVDTLLATGRWGKVGTKFELATAWCRRAAEAEQRSTDSRAAEAAEPAAAAAERAASAAERSTDIAERTLKTASAANTRATIALAFAAISIIAPLVIAYLRPS